MAIATKTIAEEMKEAVWERVEPPLWWDAIQDYIVADIGDIGGLRGHMVRGHVDAGRVVNNAHVIGQADWPNARYSDTKSHLSATALPAFAATSTDDLARVSKATVGAAFKNCTSKIILRAGN